MPRTCIHLVATLLAGVAVAHAPGQIPAPAAASQSSQSSPSPNLPGTAGTIQTRTIQTRTNLVVVDVVVTDRSGKNVHGLQQTDFAVTEKGVPQQIRSFEEHTAPAQPPVPEPMPELPPGTFTNFSPAPQTAALNILLFDSLNTPLKDQSFVRQQLLEYIRTAPAGNRIALFGLTTHLIYLQGFTSDPGLLKAAIDKRSMRASQLLDNPANGGPGTQLSDTIGGAEASSHGGIGATVANLKQFEAESASFQIQLRSRYTLDAMNVLARYLSGFPGRKNLIWFSGSFPLSILPDGDLIDPFAAMADMSAEFRDTATLLTRSQVAVYPVDARGLFNAPMYDASERGTASPQAFSQQLNKFNQQTALEHLTMRQMAEQTGGRAFVNTNGLKQAVETAITTGANFYTITYSPKDTNWNGGYRKIGLKLEGRFAPSNLSLAYRRGYFAVDPNPPTQPRRVLTAGGGTLPAPPSPTAMRAAMLRGAPDPTQIIFKARVLPVVPGSAPPQDAPDADTRSNSDPKLAHGPWRSYAVDIAAIPGQLLVSHSANGDLSGTAEFVVHCYDSEGTLITATSKAVRLDLAAEKVQQFLHSGVPMHLVISVPAKGEYFLRIGVHDLVEDHVGALELPLSAIKNLPPGASPPAASQPPAPAQP